MLYLHFVLFAIFYPWLAVLLTRKLARSGNCTPVRVDPVIVHPYAVLVKMLIVIVLAIALAGGGRDLFAQVVSLALMLWFSLIAAALLNDPISMLVESHTDDQIGRPLLKRVAYLVAIFVVTSGLLLLVSLQHGFPPSKLLLHEQLYLLSVMAAGFVSVAVIIFLAAWIDVRQSKRVYVKVVVPPMLEQALTYHLRRPTEAVSLNNGQLENHETAVGRYTQTAQRSGLSSDGTLSRSEIWPLFKLDWLCAEISYRSTMSCLDCDVATAASSWWRFRQRQLTITCFWTLCCSNQRQCQHQRQHRWQLQANVIRPAEGRLPNGVVLLPVHQLSN